MGYKTKKGISLGESFGAVLSIVLVAVLVIISIYLFASLQSSFSGVSTGTTLNESGAWLNGSGYSLDNSSLCQFASPVITSAVNATDGTTIVSANYTVSATGLLLNATEYNTVNVELNYTYTWGSEACTAAGDNITSFAAYPALVGLVGTIVFLGLVIGVLVASFVFKSRNRA